MFLSTYENKLDKKWRVSVPASFRSFLSSMGYNGVICYPSFNNPAIEGCAQNRIEKLSDSIDSLNPLKKKEIFLLLLFYRKVQTCSLIAKEEYLYQKNY